MFLERTLQLIEENGITKNKLLIDLHLNKNSFVNWNKGSVPNSDTVSKIAQYFDVSTDYLLGNTDDRRQKPGEENITFDDFTFAMHNETKDLTAEDKQMLIDMARMMKNRIKEKKELENKTND